MKHAWPAQGEFKIKWTGLVVLSKEMHALIQYPNHHVQSTFQVHVHTSLDLERSTMVDILILYLCSLNRRVFNILHGIH